MSRLVRLRFCRLLWAESQVCPSAYLLSQAVPVEGAIESLHSAGQYLVLAASDLGGFPEGVNGSLIVLDFAGGPGFGCSTEPATRGTARAGAGSGSGQRQRRQAKQQSEQQDEAGGKRAKRVKQQEGEQQRRQAKGKGKAKGGGGRTAAQRGSKVAAEEEPGPSRKRARR